MANSKAGIIGQIAVSYPHLAFITSGNNFVGIDTNHLAIHIDQRASGIAGIDCRVCLNIRHAIVTVGLQRAVQSGNLPTCQCTGEIQTAWISNCQHLIANFHLINITKYCRF